MQMFNLIIIILVINVNLSFCHLNSRALKKKNLMEKSEDDGDPWENSRNRRLKDFLEKVKTKKTETEF